MLPMQQGPGRGRHICTQNTEVKEQNIKGSMKPSAEHTRRRRTRYRSALRHLLPLLLLLLV